MSEKRKPGNRIMGQGYARALRLIFNGGATWKTIAQDLNLGRLTAQRVCHAFNDMGLCHVVAYTTENADMRARTAVYKFGPGTDLAWPGGGMKRTKRAPGIEMLTFGNAVKELQVASHCGKTLAAEVGYSQRTARDILRALKQQKLIHVDGFTRHASGGDGYPTFTWGPGLPDAVKRAPQPDRVLWTRGNQVKREKLAQAKLLRAMVLGKPLDGRSCAQNPAHFPKGHGARATAPKSEPVSA